MVDPTIAAQAAATMMGVRIPVSSAYLIGSSLSTNADILSAGTDTTHRDTPLHKRTMSRYRDLVRGKKERERTRARSRSPPSSFRHRSEVLAESERQEQLVLVVAHDLALRDPAVAEAQSGAAAEVDAGVVDLLEQDLVVRRAILDLHDAELHHREEFRRTAAAQRQPLHADARQPVVDVAQVTHRRVVRGN